MFDDVNGHPFLKGGVSYTQGQTWLRKIVESTGQLLGGLFLSGHSERPPIPSLNSPSKGYYQAEPLEYDTPIIHRLNREWNRKPKLDPIRPARQPRYLDRETGKVYLHDELFPREKNQIGSYAGNQGMGRKDPLRTPNADFRSSLPNTTGHQYGAIPKTKALSAPIQKQSSPSKPVQSAFSNSSSSNFSRPRSDTMSRYPEVKQAFERDQQKMNNYPPRSFFQKHFEDLTLSEQEQYQADLKKPPVRYFPAERRYGPNSLSLPKRLSFNDAQDLSNKLYAHYYGDTGQAVQIDLGKFPVEELKGRFRYQKIAQIQHVLAVARTYYQTSFVEGKPVSFVEQWTEGSKTERQKRSAYFSFSASGQYCVIALNQDITGFAPKLLFADDEGIPASYWLTACLGRVAFNHKKPVLIYDFKTGRVTYIANLVQTGEQAIRNGLSQNRGNTGERLNPYALDLFDFNPDAARGQFLDLVTVIIHNTGTLEGPDRGTSFWIEALPGTFIDFIDEFDALKVSE